MKNTEDVGEDIARWGKGHVIGRHTGASTELGIAFLTW